MLQQLMEQQQKQMDLLMEGLVAVAEFDATDDSKEAEPENTEDEDKWSAMRKPGTRTLWEERVFQRHIAPVFESDEALAEAYKLYGPKENESSVFVNELLEKEDFDGLAPVVRSQLLPALWRYRPAFSLEDFTMELNISGGAQKHPVLSAFLMEEPQLRALPYIPAVVHWQRLLLNRYNRRLDHNTALQLTVGEVLEQAPDRMVWEEAFKGFQLAWNEGWKFVERFNCTLIPEVYKQVRMDRSTPIAFSLPSEKDEGICPLQLARFLGEKHNRMVEMVDELLLMRGEDLQRASTRQPVVSSKFFSSAHCLKYDLHGQFVPFLENQCVQYTTNGQVLYDFEHAEQYVLDVFFSGKPLIDLELRMAQFTNPDQATTSRLRQKVRQEVLPKDVAEQIIKELGSPSAARVCLELIETCTSFIMATGGALVQRLNIGERYLGDYTKSVLMMEHAEFGSPTVAKQVQLKHIDAVWKMLQDYSIVDHFANIRPKYRQSLPPPAARGLTTLASRLDLDLLLPLMKEFITGQLCEDHIGAAVTIKSVIAYLQAGDDALVDFPWFEQIFPEDILMCCALHTYETLEAAGKEE